MTAPLFSIVTPTFNSGPKLDTTIQSVLTQQRGLLEYFVVDGGSTDGTVSRLKAYGSGLQWQSQPDRGVYDAMNTGIGLAQGQFLYFLCAGDTLRPGILQKVAGLLPRDPHLFAYGSIHECLLDRRFNGRYSRLKLSRVNICQQAIFYGRGIFDLVGRFNLRYPILADYVHNLRCFGHADVRKLYLDEVIAEFEGNGLSAFGRDEAFLEDRLRLFRDHLGWSPYALNKAISLIPSGLKEARYQAYRRLRSRLRLGRDGASRHENRN